MEIKKRAWCLNGSLTKYFRNTSYFTLVANNVEWVLVKHDIGKDNDDDDWGVVKNGIMLMIFFIDTCLSHDY